MCSRLPATVRLSLEPFARRGGLEGPHKDGWGLAHYVDADVNLLKEPNPAADSACVRFLQDHPFRSAMVLSHIRRATQGDVALRNCQPFVRELGGRMHVFAHNGHLEAAGLQQVFGLRTFAPVGDTDSEHAFCGLLESMRTIWRAGSVPALADRTTLVGHFAAMLRRLGPANFIYSDGDALFVHGDRRTHPDGIRPPGLHVLRRRCPVAGEHSAGAGLVIDSAADQEVVFVASVPLDDHPGWRALAEGELLVARSGDWAPVTQQRGLGAGPGREARSPVHAAVPP
ncbi:MAG: class II glutamine amidotransferase [Burkholderiales bacterium]|nr:class II glutamine amidotransferase [Burkholderiales bacterium]